MKPLTNSDIDVWLESNNSKFIRVSDYKNAFTKVLFRNKQTKVEHYALFNNIKKQKGRDIFRYSNDTIDKFLEDKNFERMGEVTNWDTTSTFLCKRCGTEFETCACNIKKYKCEICDNGQTKLNSHHINLFIVNKRKDYKFVSLSGEIVTLKCRKHGEECCCDRLRIKSTKTYCKSCLSEKIIARTRKLTIEDIINRCYKNNVEIIGKYNNNIKEKIDVKCSICGRGWKTTVESLYYKNSACKMCNTKEIKIYNILNSVYGADVIHHYSISRQESWIVVDFFINNHNIIVEYNGKQHYEPVRFGGCDIEKAKENLNRQMIRDLWVSEYCKNNNITLINIPYWVEISDVERIVRNGGMVELQKYIKNIDSNIKPLINTNSTSTTGA